MNDRDIEDTRQSPDEEETFECDLCGFEYSVSVDHVTIELYINKVFGRQYVDKIVCVYCSDKISDANKQALVDNTRRG